MINVKCNRCGVVNIFSNEVCKACGLELSSVSPLPGVTYDEPSHARYANVRTPGSSSIASIKPFNGIGDVLGPTITLFSRNVWLITKIVLVIVVPFEIFKVLSIGEIAGSPQVAIGIFALQLFCNLLIAPALIYALMKVMQTGIAPGINESYRWGLNKIGKLSLCALMAWVLELVGSVFCIIPGIFLMVAFELVYPMAVLEDGSPTEILKRSYHRTKGHRWQILGATFLTSIMIALGSAPASIAVTWFAASGIDPWPIQSVAAIISDILSQGATILSLVIYLSILRTLEWRQSVIE